MPFQSAMRADCAAGRGVAKVHRSSEYGSTIIHAMATGTPAVVYGNMPNRGAIANLPDTAIAEAPTVVDRSGLRFTTVGELPPQLIGYMQPHVTQHELFIRAATEGRRDHLYLRFRVASRDSWKQSRDVLCALRPQYPLPDLVPARPHHCPSRRIHLGDYKPCASASAVSSTAKERRQLRRQSGLSAVCVNGL